MASDTENEIVLRERPVGLLQRTSEEVQVVDVVGLLFDAQKHTEHLSQRTHRELHQTVDVFEMQIGGPPPQKGQDFHAGRSE